MENAHIATIVGLGHSYSRAPGNAVEVLRDVSFAISAGECVAIVGPSGADKSTLLKCIAGLLNPTAGTVAINSGSPMAAMKAQAIGFAFQEPALLDWRTVWENIALPLELGGNTSRSDSSSRIAALLQLTDLTEFACLYPTQLSGGMKQRVSLARALAIQPRLLLLDEPFGSLDLLTRFRLSLELGRILFISGVATIVVTHSIEEAIFFGTRVLILSGHPASIVERIEVPFAHPREEGLFSDAKFHALVDRARSVLLGGSQFRQGDSV